MKRKLFVMLIGFLIVNTSIYSQLPDPLLELTVSTNSDEQIIRVNTEDTSEDHLRIGNATAVDNQFAPAITGHQESDPRTCFFLVATTLDTYDVFNDRPMMVFNSRIGLQYTSGQEEVTNRLLFGWSNYTEMRMVLSASGNLGIGTLSPQHKIQVTDGDVFIEDINKGVIMKSPNGDCWRVTVGNDGNLITTLLQNCQ